jgi:hypothetical protein
MRCGVFFFLSSELNRVSLDENKKKERETERETARVERRKRVCSYSKYNRKKKEKSRVLVAKERAKELCMSAMYVDIDYEILGNGRLGVLR